MSMTPEHDDAAIKRAGKKVAAGLAAGRPRTSVAQELVADGWSEVDANELVLAVEGSMQENSAKEGGGGRAGGWLVWIGVLVVINLLSWLFGWGFTIY